jgi:hypothetical protein
MLMVKKVNYIVPERKLGFFVEIKEDENFNHRNTGSISRINPPKVGGGLKFESDTDIGGKDSFRSGTTYA